MLDAWLDLVLGSSCVVCARPGRLLCGTCREGLPGRGVPVAPTPCPTGLVPCRATGEYDGALRALVLAHKEHRGFALTAPLGALLAAAVTAVPQASGSTLLVPVPSRPAVVRARGHDPMRRMTRAAAGVLRRGGADVRVTPLLRQRRLLADQAGLGIEQRRANLAGAMAADAPRLRRVARTGIPVTAIVCDDVLTTGATAREAQRALEDVGVVVAGVACVAATRRRVGPGQRLPLSETDG